MSCPTLKCHIHHKHVHLKTEKKARPLPFEAQYNYSIPDSGVRPTSPVMRLLERAHTQPFMSLQSTGPEMDPVTRQYYHRMWKSQSPSESVYVCCKRGFLCERNNHLRKKHLFPDNARFLFGIKSFLCLINMMNGMDAC